jgi:hypothetical protein
MLKQIQQLTDFQNTENTVRDWREITSSYGRCLATPDARELL